MASHFVGTQQFAYRTRSSPTFDTVQKCLTGKMKHYRRIFSRFDKLADRYLSFLQFVGSMIWLK